MKKPVVTCLLTVLLAPAAGNAHARDKASQPRIGLQKRIPWTTSRMIGSPDPPSPYVLERVFPKLSFKNPVVLTNAPGTSRLFAVELDGKIHSFPHQQAVAKTDLVFDVRKHIKGATRVYGLTFHPGFVKNRYVYVCYILKQEQKDGTRVSRFVMSKTDPPTIDPKSEKLLMTWKSGGHNGGCLKFGHDGFLYISTGDGAGAFPADDADTGQRIDDLLASILRIDVDREENGKPYAIPKDNPFVTLKGARGEVWSYGHRNPWKMSFDAKTGDLWVGDVGWEMWEMIYRVQKGDNYGWSVVESTQPVHPERKLGPTKVVPATIAHSHTEAKSITGGFVYRGKRLPELAGRYIYGDYVTGKIWGAVHDGKKIASLTELHDSTLQIICFGEDNDRELYIVTYDGTIHRLVKNKNSQVNRDFPKKLSQTGLFASTKDHTVAPGVIPYSVVAEAWLDGARAKRYVALPGKSTLGIHKENNPQKGLLKGEWAFPENSVLMKTIFLKLADGKTRKVETQILHRVADTWKAYNYVWNDQQTDAVFLEGPPKERAFQVFDGPKRTRRQTWHHASRTECALCHSSRGGSVAAFTPGQLDRKHRYGKRVGDQLATLKHVQVFDKFPKRKRLQFADPYAKHKTRARLALAARTYLHVNCSSCHRRGGGGTAQFELLMRKSEKDKYLYDSRPTQGTFGIIGAKNVAPGDPYRSVLLYRMAKLGRGRMPHFGSDRVDARGLRVIRDWIQSLKGGSQPAVSLAKHWAALSRAKTADEISRVLESSLLTNTEGALALANRLRSPDVSATQRDRIVGVAVKHADPQIRDLFEPFLPEEKRTKRLGTIVDKVALLRIQGDVARGRALFLRTSGVSCSNCHKVQGKGKEIGPDLALAAKKNTKAQLLESILKPSKKIDRKYLSYLVETKKGKVYSGLLKQRNAKQIVLIDNRAKEITIAAADVEQFVPQRKSLMPELLFRDMTAQQLADLLAFLQSLK